MGKKKSNKKSVGSFQTSSEPDTNIHTGEAEFLFENGDRYSGQFIAYRSGEICREGHGVYITKDCQRYEGLWREDKIAEDVPLRVTFPSGTQYEGKLVKSKYDGAGTYTFENKMRLSCEFKDNKPVGHLIFVDVQNKCWHGKADKEGAIFLRPNFYFENINVDRGKGRSRIKIDEESATESEDSSNVIDSDYIRQREIKTFAKRDKIPLDLKFSESSWYQKYLNLENARQTIIKKISESGVDSLTKYELKWYQKHEKFLTECNERIHKRKERIGDAIDYKAWQKKFRKSLCPGKHIKVVYATEKNLSSNMSSKSSTDNETTQEKSEDAPGM